MKHNIIKAIVALFALSLFSCQAYDAITTGDDVADFTGTYYVQHNSMSNLSFKSDFTPEGLLPHATTSINSNMVLKVIEQNGRLEIYLTETENEIDYIGPEGNDYCVKIRKEDLVEVSSSATERVFKYEDLNTVVKFTLNPLDKHLSSIYFNSNFPIGTASEGVFPLTLTENIVFYGKTNTAPQEVTKGFYLPVGYDEIDDSDFFTDFNSFISSAINEYYGADNVEHIVFQTGKTPKDSPCMMEEIPFEDDLNCLGEMGPYVELFMSLVGEPNNLWLEFDNSTKTLYINTNADEFIANKDCSYMFSELPMKTIDFGKHFNTTAVRNMSSMFYYSESIESLDLSGFNTANVEDMTQMFQNCKKITTLDLSNFNTSNGEDFSSMFSGCTSLEAVNVSSFDTFNAIYMDYMFENCTSLISLNIQNFDTRNVEYMEDMFYNCKKIQTLSLGKNFYLPEDLEEAEDMFYDFGVKSYEVTINYSHYDIKPIICKLFPLMAESKFIWKQTPAK